MFAAGTTVTPDVFVAHGAVGRSGGKTPAIKILGTGEITKKLTIQGCTFSAQAKEKIEKAGGTIKE